MFSIVGSLQLRHTIKQLHKTLGKNPNERSQFNLFHLFCISKCSFFWQPSVMLKLLCNPYARTTRFYILKTGFYRRIQSNIYIFLIFALNNRLWVLVRTLTCAHSLRLSKTKIKHITSHLIIIIFPFVKNRCMLIAWAGFQNGHILALNREPFAPFLLKPTIQTNHFSKIRWYTCLKYDEKMRHSNLIEFMGSLLLHSELQTHTIRRTQF